MSIMATTVSSHQDWSIPFASPMSAVALRQQYVIIRASQDNQVQFANIPPTVTSHPDWIMPSVAILSRDKPELNADKHPTVSSKPDWIMQSVSLILASRDKPELNADKHPTVSSKPDWIMPSVAEISANGEYCRSYDIFLIQCVVLLLMMLYTIPVYDHLYEDESHTAIPLYSSPLI